MAGTIRLQCPPMVRSALQDTYVLSCADLGKRFEQNGFRFLKTIPAVRRRANDWDFQVRFQSSTRNCAGRIVLNVWITVESKLLKRYRQQIGQADGNGIFWEGNLGFLRPDGGYREWNLWYSPQVVLNAIENLVRSDALPLFRHCSAISESPDSLMFSRHELSIIEPADMIDLLAANQLAPLIAGYLEGLQRRVEAFQNVPAPQRDAGTVSTVLRATSTSGVLLDARALHAAGYQRNGTRPSSPAGRLIEALDRVGCLDFLNAAG